MRINPSVNYTIMDSEHGCNCLFYGISRTKSIICWLSSQNKTSVKFETKYK